MKEHYQCFLWMRNLLLHPMLTTVAFNWWGTVHVARSWTSGFPFTWSFPSVQIGNYLVLFPPHCRLLPVVLKAGKLWTSVEDGTDLGWSALGLAWFFKAVFREIFLSDFFEALFDTSNSCSVSTANASPALRPLKKSPNLCCSEQSSCSVCLE